MKNRKAGAGVRLVGGVRSCGLPGCLSLRLLLHLRHAPRTLARTSASSGRWLTGMMWSMVVVVVVQPGRRSQQIGSSALTCLLSRFHGAWHLIHLSHATVPMGGGVVVPLIPLVMGHRPWMVQSVGVAAIRALRRRGPRGCLVWRPVLRLLLRR